MALYLLATPSSTSEPTTDQAYSSAFFDVASVGSILRWHVYWAIAGDGNKQLDFYFAQNVTGTPTFPYYFYFVYRKTYSPNVDLLPIFRTSLQWIAQKRDGTLAVYDAGPTLKFTGATVLSNNTDYPICLKVTDATTIELFVYTGGAWVSQGSAATFASILFGACSFAGYIAGKTDNPSTNLYFHDLWLNDSAGSVNNGFPAVLRELIYRPTTGAQTHNDFKNAAGGAATEAEWDEDASDGDTSYNKSDTTAGPLRETNPIELAVGTVPDPASEHILGTYILSVAKHQSGTTKSLADKAVVLVSGGSTYDAQYPDAAVTLVYEVQTGNYLGGGRIDDVDPKTGAAWLKAGWDAAEIGAAKLTATNSDVRHTRVFAVVAVGSGAESAPAGRRRVFVC